MEKKIDEKQQDCLTAEVREIPPDVQHGKFSEAHIDREGRKQKIGNDLRSDGRKENTKHHEQLAEEAVSEEEHRGGNEDRQNCKRTDEIHRRVQLCKPRDQRAERKTARFQQECRLAAKSRREAAVRGIPQHCQAEQIMNHKYNIARHRPASLRSILFA